MDRQMRICYKYRLPQDAWGGLRASLFINGIVFVLLPIIAAFYILITASGTVDWQMVTIVCLIGLILNLLSGIYLDLGKP